MGETERRVEGSRAEYPIIRTPFKGSKYISVFMGDKIDDAFDWLLLIMSTINGIMIGLPEALEAKKAVAGAVIPPFFY